MIKAKLLEIIACFCILGLAFASATTTADAATIAFNPANQALVQECLDSVDIELDASGDSSNAADVQITFDATKIEVIDSDADVSGVQVRTGNAYESYFVNSVNNSTGVIDLAAGSFGDNLEEKRVLATVFFRSKAGATSAQFQVNFTGIGNTTDSNVASATTSADLLTGVTNGNYTFSTGTCAADTTNPDVVFQTPQDEQTNFPLGSNLTFELIDGDSGINLNSLVTVLNGVIYDINNPGISFTGSPSSYVISLNPVTDLPDSTASSLSVSVADNSGNSKSEQILFNLPQQESTTPPTVVNPGGDAGSGGGGTSSDNVSPTVNFITPNPFGTLVGDAPLELTIADENPGVDTDSLVLNLNGIELDLNSDSINLEISGDSVVVEIQPGDLPTDTYSFLRVSGTDLAGNSFSELLVFNIPTSGVVGDGGLEECTINSDGTIENSTCLGDTIDQREVVDVISKFLSDRQNVTLFDNTFLQDSIVDRVLNEIGASGSAALFTALLLSTGLLNILALLSTPALLFNALGFLFTRKVEKPWGVVTDVSTGKPIPFAICRVYISGSLSLVSQTVTDLEGRYGFVLNPGKYRLEVSQSGFNKQVSELSISDQKGSYIKDVKLLPLGAGDVNTMNFFSRMQLWFQRQYARFSNFLFGLGFLFSSLALLFSPNIINAIIFAIYGVILGTIIYTRLRARNKFASVIDSETNLRIPYVNVKIFDPNTWELVDTVSTNDNGLFDYWGSPGEYALLAVKRGYKFPSKNNADLTFSEKYHSLIKVNLKKGGNRLVIYMDPTTEEYFSKLANEYEPRVSQPQTPDNLSSPFAN